MNIFLDSALTINNLICAGGTDNSLCVHDVDSTKWVGVPQRIGEMLGDFTSNIVMLYAKVSIYTECVLVTRWTIRLRSFQPWKASFYVIH